MEWRRLFLFTYAQRGMHIGTICKSGFAYFFNFSGCDRKKLIYFAVSIAKMHIFELRTSI